MPAGQFILCNRCACRMFYFSFSFLLPILVSLSILAFLIPARTSPSRACRKGFDSFSAVSLSRPCSCSSHQAPIPSIHHSPPLAIYSHYIPSQSPYTPHYTHFTYFMTPPLLSFCLCLGSSLLLCLWFFRSNDVCPALPEVYYAAVASVVHLLALSAMRVPIATAGTIVFIVLDTTIAMLLLLDLSTPHKMASFEYGKILRRFLILGLRE